MTAIPRPRDPLAPELRPAATSVKSAAKPDVTAVFTGPAARRGSTGWFVMRAVRRR